MHRLQELSGEHDPRIQPPPIEAAPAVEHYQAQPPLPSGRTDCHSHTQHFFKNNLCASEESERDRQRLESRLSELQGRNEELLATVEHLQQQKPIKVRSEWFKPPFNLQSSTSFLPDGWLVFVQEVVKVPYPVPVTPRSTVMSPVTPGNH